MIKKLFCSIFWVKRGIPVFYFYPNWSWLFVFVAIRVVALLSTKFYLEGFFLEFFIILLYSSWYVSSKLIIGGDFPLFVFEWHLANYLFGVFFSVVLCFYRFDIDTGAFGSRLILSSLLLSSFPSFIPSRHQRSTAQSNWYTYPKVIDENCKVYYFCLLLWPILSTFPVKLQTFMQMNTNRR